MKRYVNPRQMPDGVSGAVGDNFQSLEDILNDFLQFIYWGVGAPTSTPPGRALYLRLDGGAATTLYVYEGAGWVGK